MKKLIKSFIVLAVISFTTNTFASELGMNMTHMNMYAASKSAKSSGGGKAFEGKGSKVITIGLGLSSYIGEVGKGGFASYYGGGLGFGSFFYSGTLSVQAEFGVHDYVGVGLVTGIGGRKFSGFGSGGVLYVPVGILANFHFFQLIADKKNVAIGDKLDMFFGLNIGSGIAVYLPGGKPVNGIIFAGPQFGVRYFFNDMIGVNFEVGYGKSIVEGGVSIKL
ncbi:MAG: hypothetical protein U0T77_08650 [Chitinophagales bacterium]